MAAVAIIIVGIAAYTFSHFSAIDMKQGLIMIAVGIIGIFIVMGIIILLIRHANLKK
jgi:nitrate reductase gamma subunit